MSTNPNKLNWKIAATVGSIAGVAIGGFAFAAPDDDWLPTPDGVVLQNNANSAPRLSAPVVVPTTVAQLASAASVTIPAQVEIPELSAPSPVPTTGPVVLAPAPLEIDSPMSPMSAVSVPSPASPMSPVSAPSPVSPMSPVSVPSPASPISPASPGSGADS